MSKQHTFIASLSLGLLCAVAVAAAAQDTDGSWVTPPLQSNQQYDLTATRGTHACTVAVGDSIQATAGPGFAGTMYLYAQCALVTGPFHVHPGQQYLFHFDAPGVYEASLRNGADKEAAHLSVTVVSVHLPPRIVCEVGYERTVAATIEPASASGSIAFEANDTDVGFDQPSSTVYVRPRVRGDLHLSAVIQAPNGPRAIARSPILEFTKESPGIRNALIAGNVGIGVTAVTMRPYIPDVYLEFHMFAHGATFAGGVRDLLVNTDDVADSGQPLFRQEQDPATGEISGTMLLELDVPADSTQYCFWWQASQINSPRVSVSWPETVNGCGSKVEVAGGEYDVPEATDERDPYLAQTDFGRRQVEQLWAPQRRLFGVKETGCPGAPYKLILYPHDYCGRGADDGMTDRLFGSSKLPCPYEQTDLGKCGTELMRFEDGCGLEWPKAACRTTNNECFNLPLHTGVTVQDNDLGIYDCRVGAVIAISESFFKVFHTDIAGVVAGQPLDGRSRMPDAVSSIFNPSDRPVTFRGKKVGVFQRGKGKLRTRIVSSDPDKVRISRSPSITVPAGVKTVDALADLLPNECIEVSPGGECDTGPDIVYLYGLQGGDESEADIVAETLETWGRCEGGGLVDSVHWTLADVEHVFVYPSIELQYRVFIPGDHIVGPPYDFCGRYITIGEQVLFVGNKQKYYAADNQNSPDPRSEHFRLHQSLVIDVTDEDQPLVENGAKKEAGLTKSYTEDAIYNNGTLDAGDDDGVFGDCYLAEAIGFANIESLTGTAESTGAGEVVAHLVGGAFDPLVNIAAADIDWDIYVRFRRDGSGGVTYRVVGDHDGFPAHEVDINETSVYFYTPGPGPWDYIVGAPSNLFPPNDIDVDEGGIVTPE